MSVIIDKARGTFSGEDDVDDTGARDAERVSVPRRRFVRPIVRRSPGETTVIDQLLAAAETEEP